MDKNKQQEQIDKLKQLKEKELPENVRKSIAEKEKHVKTPFNK
jgi:membrane protein involved in colicin uptake